MVKIVHSPPLLNADTYSNERTDTQRTVCTHPAFVDIKYEKKLFTRISSCFKSMHFKLMASDHKLNFILVPFNSTWYLRTIF